MMDEVITTLFDPSDIFRSIFFRHRLARHRHRRSAVAFQSPDSSDNDRTVGSKSAETTFKVPEFFKTDIRAESRLGYMVIGEFKTDLVGDDGTLTDSDICKGTGMNNNRLPFQRLHQARI